MRTGYRVASTGPAGKTRPEIGSTRHEDSPVFDAGKTVVLATKRLPPVVGWMVVVEGGQKGDDFRLREGKNILGTASDAEVKLADSTVSQKHASLQYKDGKFVLTDLDSTNGTFVNDNPESVARIELHDNDTVRIGETSLKFKCL
jgi:pSer/pThr/pTyr-binding forkhead associated (FHA) protein